MTSSIAVSDPPSIPTPFFFFKHIASAPKNQLFGHCKTEGLRDVRGMRRRSHYWSVLLRKFSLQHSFLSPPSINSSSHFWSYSFSRLRQGNLTKLYPQEWSRVPSLCIPRVMLSCLRRNNGLPSSPLAAPLWSKDVIWQIYFRNKNSFYLCESRWRQFINIKNSWPLFLSVFPVRKRTGRYRSRKGTNGQSVE